MEAQKKIGRERKVRYTHTVIHKEDIQDTNNDVIHWKLMKEIFLIHVKWSKVALIKILFAAFCSHKV